MTNGPGEMQRSETVKMEETQAVNTLDETANLKIDDDLLMDKNDFSSLLNSTTGSATDLHQIYQMIHGSNEGQRSTLESASHHSHSRPHDQYTSGRFSSTSGLYRDNPAIDETTTMPFSGSIALHNEMSMMGDDTTTYVPNSVHHSSPPATRPVPSDYDAATISTLLGPFEKINPADDQFNRSAADYGESPHKMSRVGTADVSVDKLFSNEDAQQQQIKEGFQFRKFGMEINLGQRSPPDTGNQNSMYSAPQTSLDTGMPAQQLHSMTSPTSLTPNMNSMKDGGYHENVDQISPSPSHYSVPHSLRNNRRNLLHNTPPLTQSFPDRHGNIMLKILKQPEGQHRARYMTEGSRGAVKDTQQQGHPVIQLLGYDDDARLEIFIGADSGKVKPHGFYQACRISGKNASVSREREVDGTVVIEMEFEKTKNMTATIDCIGILKLRNTDVEKRIGLLKTKKKSTKCRLIYRVNIARNDGSVLTLQTASTVIACTQPAGQPEISRMSLHMSPLTGGQSLFVIGKNFVKGFRVKFQELEKGSEEIAWEQEADVDHEFTHTTHFICTIPAYKNEYSYGVINTQIVVEACGGNSEPIQFQYHPESAKESIPMRTSPVLSTNSLATQSSTSISSSCNSSAAAIGAGPVSNNGSPNSIVSPEALELVAQLQQQQTSHSSSKMFRIPDGVDFISQDSNSQHRSNSFVSDAKPIGVPSHVLHNDQMSGSLLNYSSSSSVPNVGNSRGGNNSSADYLLHQ